MTELTRWLVARFTVGDGCWLWTGWTGRDGYGRCSLPNPDPTGPRQNHRLAHRVVYEELVGPIPAGLELDHLCRNRACVKPAHLEPVTHTENNRRGVGMMWDVQKARTACPKGHAYDEANTIRGAKGRSCRTCRNANRRARRAAVILEAV
jgi:hypothetical protein